MREQVAAASAAAGLAALTGATAGVAPERNSSVRAP